MVCVRLMGLIAGIGEFFSCRSKSGSELESVNGRRQFTNEIIPSFDARSHIRSSYTHDESGNTIKLLRVGLPFGSRTSQTASTPLIQNAGGSSPSDEAGVYFMGMARSASRIEAILDSQFGSGGDGAFGRDRLLAGTLARSDLGGFFYAPNIVELAQKRYFVTPTAERTTTIAIGAGSLASTGRASTGTTTIARPMGGCSTIIRTGPLFDRHARARSGRP